MIQETTDIVKKVVGELKKNVTGILFLWYGKED
jgi:hypothetical protein